MCHDSIKESATSRGCQAGTRHLFCTRRWTLPVALWVWLWWGRRRRADTMEQKVLRIKPAAEKNHGGKKGKGKEKQKESYWCTTPFCAGKLETNKRLYRHTGSCSLVGTGKQTSQLAVVRRLLQLRWTHWSKYWYQCWHWYWWIPGSIIIKNVPTSQVKAIDVASDQCQRWIRNQL